MKRRLTAYADHGQYVEMVKDQYYGTQFGINPFPFPKTHYRFHMKHSDLTGGALFASALSLQNLPNKAEIIGRDLALGDQWHHINFIDTMTIKTKQTCPECGQEIGDKDARSSKRDTR